MLHKVLLIWGALLVSVMAEVKLSVLTFNIWDLFVAHDRRLRMRAILDELLHPTEHGAIRSHDIIAFQEMWDPSTYRLFKRALSDALPYSQYYNHGSLGSGLAIFSRHPILRINFKEFSLNGHPDRIADGDWFVTKGVAYAQIQHPKMLLDVFTTHLIADYSDHRGTEGDHYHAHRIAQAYELMDFVNIHLGGGAALLMGDFNFEMTSVEWRAFLKKHSAMKSVYDGMRPADIPCTCNCPNNGYSHSKAVPITIDQIVYSFESLRMTLLDVAFTEDLWLRLKKKSLDEYENVPKSFSDHFGVAAEFTLLDKQPNLQSQSQRIFSGAEAIGEAIDILRKETRFSKQSVFVRWIYSWASIIMMIIIMITLYYLYNFESRPKVPFYILLILLPLVTTALLFNLTLVNLHFPREAAYLEQFITELTYLSNHHHQ